LKGSAEAEGFAPKANILKIAKTGFEWYYLVWILQIAGIAFLIGILFVVGWLKKTEGEVITQV
jgi:hypothetical protein